jgi:hypothetical protein
MLEKMPVLETNHLNKLLKTLKVIKETRLSAHVGETETKSASLTKKVKKKEEPNEM